ncbi:MAG: hypothetical protein HRT35_19945 [Algicola sp.]|nr:hypothetical protein [Algicola sp.]
MIDSLDESGDLSQIHDVLASVHKINKNAPMDSPCHKIIVATRPIDKELTKAIGEFKSKCSKDAHPQFISLYGFKAAQFDTWLKAAVLNKLAKNEALQPNEDSVGSLLIKGWQQPDFSAHKTLKENKVLGEQELVKPLFAYILYQLLSNNITIPASGRVGIYLAFLHYITSQAKFVHDTDVTTEDEHCNRKVLHAIAALWCKQRSTGKQSVLAKEDINFSLLGTNTPDDQGKAQIERIDELKFLSHSYFGDNEQQLHFQHQSFAEILLAEYYLKVFVGEALEDEPGIMSTRQHLFVGEPTVATMEFFVELIKLLVKSVVTDDEEPNEAVLVARRLLLPTIGSLATPFFRKKLHSQYLKVQFYGRSNHTLINESKLLNERWPIDETVLNNLMSLASDILDQKNSLRLTPAKPTTALFGNELILLEEGGDCGRPDVDKWLAILMGGLVARELSPRQYFFENESRGKQFFQLIQDSPQREAPKWVSPVSEGIFHRLNLFNMDLKGITLNGFDFNGSTFSSVDFRFSLITSKLEDCQFHHLRMRDCLVMGSLSYSTFGYSAILNSRIIGAAFINLKTVDILTLSGTLFDYLKLPNTLSVKFSGDIHHSGHVDTTRSVLGTLREYGEIIEEELTGLRRPESIITLIESGLKLEIFTKADITYSFEFMSKRDRDLFISSWPDELKPLFTNIRNDPDYLELERRYYKQ